MPPQLLETAIFGRQVEGFLGSDLGKYLVLKAETEAEDATEILKKVYPWRRRKIQELQNTIWRAESFQQWLADAVVDGMQATNLLEEEHS